MSGVTRAEADVPLALAGGELRLERIDLRNVPLADLRRAIRDRLPRAGAAADPSVRSVVRTIVEDVRARGADAVRDASRRFGGGSATGELLIGRTVLASAAQALRPSVRDAILAAAENVRSFARTQLPTSTWTETVPGVSIERRWVPLERAGAYVPGGGAPYPSSLVMTVVPARVAGVRSIVVATPARRDGFVDPVLLGAAGLLQVDEILVAGGAQAIAALALGLAPDDGFEGLAQVDRVVGPGNAWVTAAKVELVAEVGIDVPAGPSEGMVVADDSADEDLVAADLLTQAEHGPDSPAILVTPSGQLADSVETAVRRRLATAARRGVLDRSLAAHGRIVLVDTLDAAALVVDGYAPEHLSVDVAPLEDFVGRIRNAGSVFVGRWSPESAGDYATGANHVLPTGGLARSCGALSVEAFGKWIQVQRVTREGLAGLRPTIVALAEAEGLLAHRDAVEVRFE